MQFCENIKVTYSIVQTKKIFILNSALSGTSLGQLGQLLTLPVTSIWLDDYMDDNMDNNITYMYFKIYCMDDNIT